MIQGLAAALWLLPESGTLELLAQGSGILVMLAAAVLVYRTYRERYLAVWIGGWLLYFLYRTGQTASEMGYGSHGLQGLSQVAFIVSIGFFVSSVFYYTDARRYLRPLVGTVALASAITLVRAFWFPYSPLLALAVHLLYRVLTTAGAIRLALFSRGRRELGPWLMTLMLLSLHLDESWGAVHGVAGVDTVIEVFLGLSMLMIVLDDSRARTRRLAVVNVITTAIAEAQEYGSMMAIALGELKALHHASSAWFRLVEGDRLVLAQHIGLTSEFVEARRSIPLNDSDNGRVLRERICTQVRSNAVHPDLGGQLERAGIEHVVLIPVTGKNSVIGVLSLGVPRPRAYTRDELQFLITTADQLGIAVENLRMFEQILRSQRQWVRTFDSIEDAILVHDSTGSIMKVNRTLLGRLGHRFHVEVVHQNCKDILPNAQDGCPYCRRTDEYVDTADPCFGGFSLVSTSSYSEEGGKGSGTIHIIKDTTERRAAEERYRLLFEEVQEGVFISTADGHLLACNKAFVKMLGYSTRAEVLALNIGEHFYESPLQREMFLQFSAKDGFVRNLEVSLRRKDGTLITVLENSFSSRDANGVIERIQGFLVDITEKKRVEDEIRRRNRELHALNSIAVIATQSFDLDEILNVTLRQVIELLSAESGSILFFDVESATLMRKAHFGAAGNRQSTTLTLPPDFVQKLVASRMESVTERQEGILPPIVKKLIAEEGLESFVWVNMWSQDKPIGVIGVGSRKAGAFTSRDASLLVAIGRQLATTVEKVRLYEETSRAYEDLRKTQEQLLQSEKMSAVGQLISGVAHELNNPLTAILGYAQLLEGEPIDERSRDFVQKLYKQAQRTHRVVQNLLSFARQRKPIKQHCDLRRVMEDTLALRDYDLKLNNIVVNREFASDLPQVVADSHQVEQVFLNIVNNAADAMLEGSRGGELRVRIYVADDHVCVEFHDSGPGIKNAKRIFDPFFTTKKVGKGTGLGLSICYGILKEHNGDIVAFNHAEGGAVFQVLLPIAERISPMPQNKPSVSSPNFVGGRILLVDDEEAILEFETEVLRGAGAEVIARASGEEAVALLQSETFDAIILDGKMPGGWSGQDIYRWMVENRAGMERRILFTVSHAADPELRSFLQTNNVPCIVKPFEVADLLSMVRRTVLRAKATAV